MHSIEALGERLASIPCQQRPTYIPLTANDQRQDIRTLSTAPRNHGLGLLCRHLLIYIICPQPAQLIQPTHPKQAPVSANSSPPPPPTPHRLHTALQQRDRPTSLMTTDIQNLKSFDPFAEAEDSVGDQKTASQNYIHIRIQRE
jgi:hypothetical protein